MLRLLLVSDKILVSKGGVAISRLRTGLYHFWTPAVA